ILAIDDGGGGETRPAAPRLPADADRRRAQELRVEHNGLGHAVQGEVAADLVLVLARAQHLRGLERERRVLVDLEEVRAPEVRVALLIAGVDAGRLDRGVDLDRRRIGLVEDDGAREVVEHAVDLGEEVADLEAHLGVRGVDLPRGRRGRGERGRGGEREQYRERSCRELHGGLLLEQRWRGAAAGTWTNRCRGGGPAARAGESAPGRRVNTATMR